MADDLWGSTTARGVYNGDLTYYDFKPGSDGEKIQRDAAKAELAKALSASYGTRDSMGKSLAAPSQATGLMGVGSSKPDTGYAEKAGAFAGDLIGGMAPQTQQATGPMDDSGMYAYGPPPGLFDPASAYGMEPIHSTAIPQAAPSFSFGPMQMEQTAQAVQEAAPVVQSAPAPAVVDMPSAGGGDVGSGMSTGGGGLVAALDTNSYAVDPLTGGTYNPGYDYQVDPLTGGTYDGGAMAGGYTGGQQAQQGSFDPWGGSYGSGA